MRTIVSALDRMSIRLGGWASWLTLALVAVSAYDTFMRFVLRAPPVWAYQTVSIIGGTMYVLGWAYVMTTRTNVRMDVLYRLFPPRIQATIDALSQLVLFLPIMALLLYMSFTWAVRAYVNQEVMAYTLWYPPAWPFRFIVFVGFFLFTLAGLNDMVKRAYFVLRGRNL